MTTATTGAATAAAAAKEAGFTGPALVLAVAIAGAESGFNPSAVGHNINGTVDRGLWQINSVHTQFGATQMMDPVANAKAAYAISGGGVNWRPWTTYLSGAYQSHLEDATLAVSQLGGTGAGIITGTGPLLQPYTTGTSWSWPFPKQFLAAIPAGGLFGGARNHQGVDFDMQAGTPLTAVTDGVVHTSTHWGTDASGNPGWETTVTNAASGVSYVYGHVSKFVVADGTAVKAGDVIALSGGIPGNAGAGDSSGAHVHFQMTNANGKVVDPLPFLTNLFNQPQDSKTDQGIASAAGDAVSNAWSSALNAFTSWVSSHALRVGLFILGVTVAVVALWALLRPPGQSPKAGVASTAKLVSEGV